MDETLKKIIDEFLIYPSTKSIAFGGSSVVKRDDGDSDIDIYVFVDKEIPVEKRYSFIKKYSTEFEIGCDYFGSGDEFFVEDINKQLDIMYFKTDWMEKEYINAYRNFDAKNGYTTCFLFTLKNCKIIYDKYNWLQDLKDKLDKPYPKFLKENIIKRNMMLIKDKPFASYYEQIKKAIKRKDINSINHRIAAFMASYFDIIFANNELLHPGEKGLVDYALKNCKILPVRFEKNINALLNQPNSNTLEILDDMIIKLKNSTRRRRKKL